MKRTLVVLSLVAGCMMGGINPILAAWKCGSASFRSEVTSLSAQLRELGYSSEEGRYLLGVAARRASSWGLGDLNDAGRACGTAGVGAMMIGCTKATLAKTLRSTAGDAAEQVAAPISLAGIGWERKRYSRRELAFIGTFQGCYVAAGGVFLR
ncbi:hypothetical protein [Ancylobacter terrae]|uniref:hypothetical protein n=1 Tax=Ancylobacter sp. sgz301288 TaxID=3342077 RepID=UPI00385EA074